MGRGSPVAATKLVLAHDFKDEKQRRLAAVVMTECLCPSAKAVGSFRRELDSVVACPRSFPQNMSLRLFVSLFMSSFASSQIPQRAFGARYVELLSGGGATTTLLEQRSSCLDVASPHVPHGGKGRALFVRVGGSLGSKPRRRFVNVSSSRHEVEGFSAGASQQVRPARALVHPRGHEQKPTLAGRA